MNKILRRVSHVLFIIAFFVVGYGVNNDLKYQAVMPKQPTLERSVLLQAGRGRKIYVTGIEYKKYQQIDAIKRAGFYTCFLAAIALFVLTKADPKGSGRQSSKDCR